MSAAPTKAAGATPTPEMPKQKVRKPLVPGRKMSEDEAREMVFREFRETFELLAKHPPTK